MQSIAAQERSEASVRRSRRSKRHVACPDARIRASFCLRRNASPTPPIAHPIDWDALSLGVSARRMENDPFPGASKLHELKDFRRLLLAIGCTTLASRALAVVVGYQVYALTKSP